MQQQREHREHEDSSNVKTNSTTNTITQCPNRLIRKIATFLSSRDVLPLTYSCRQLHQTLSISTLVVTDKPVTFISDRASAMRDFQERQQHRQLFHDHDHFMVRQQQQQAQQHMDLRQAQQRIDQQQQQQQQMDQQQAHPFQQLHMNQQGQQMNQQAPMHIIRQQQQQQQQTPTTFITRRLIARIHVPLVHKTQSMVVKLQYDPDTCIVVNNSNNATVMNLYIMSHSVHLVPSTSFSNGQIIHETVLSLDDTPNVQSMEYSFVPRTDRVYTLWTGVTHHAVGAAATTTAIASWTVPFQVYNLIFDTATTKMVSRVYSKLYRQMGPLHNSPLLYLRMLQSLANTLLLQLRYNGNNKSSSFLTDTIHDPWWKELLQLPCDQAHVQTLAEIVTWVEEDVSKMDAMTLRNAIKTKPDRRRHLDDGPHNYLANRRRRQRVRLPHNDR